MSKLTIDNALEFFANTSAIGGQAADDYINRIFVEGLSVDVTGSFVGAKSAARLLDLYQRTLSNGGMAFSSDRRYLLVGANPGTRYNVALQLTDGGLLGFSLPAALEAGARIRCGVRFPASVTRLIGPRECEDRALATLESFDYRPDSVTLSCLDLAVDTRKSVGVLTSGIAGGSYHGGDYVREVFHRRTGALLGIWGPRRETSLYRPLVYDKRLQVGETRRAGRASSFDYPRYWRSVGLPEDSPITRAEIRLDRHGLRAHGLHSIGDLSPEAIEGLWRWFTKWFFCFRCGRELNPYWETLSQSTCSSVLRGITCARSAHTQQRVQARTRHGE